MSSNLPDRIEIFTCWTGFADPPMRVAKLVVAHRGDHYSRHYVPGGDLVRIGTDCIRELLRALNRPHVPALELKLFDIPEPVLRSHFGSMWTDDSPSHLVVVSFSSGRKVSIRATTQHAFMLPLSITDDRNAVESLTYDPRLSKAIADLMPRGYLDKERLAGNSSMLEYDLREWNKDSAEQTAESARVPVMIDPAAMKEGFDEVFRILNNEESPAEKAEAERTGKLSERLLRRITINDMQRLLARGADPCVSDDVGQTALMHAAYPPFDRDKFRLLVNAGANVDARRNDGFTGLHIASSGGEVRAVAEWLQAGADVHARAPHDATALTHGASWSEIVRLLLDAGAPVNAVDQDGHSAIVYAILKQCRVQPDQQILAMKMLLEAGADINRADHAGLTSREHARQMLARTRLEDEVVRACNPGIDRSNEFMEAPLRMAESVVRLVES